MSMAKIVELLTDISRTSQFHDIRVDKGKVFYVKTRLDAQSAPVNFYIRTGDIPLHALTSIESTLKCVVALIEDVTVASGAEGTRVTLRNYSRCCPDNGLEARVYTGATYSNGITIMATQAGFGTAPGLATSTVAGSPFKRILKPNCNYIFLLTPSAATDINIDAAMMERRL